MSIEQEIHKAAIDFLNSEMRRNSGGKYSGDYTEEFVADREEPYYSLYLRIRAIVEPGVRETYAKKSCQ
jgi:hypothetical protein